MKRAVLIIVSALALVGLLIADLAYPGASIAEETPAAAPAAEAAATPEAASAQDAATSAVPKDAIAEAPDSASQDTKAEEASTQGMPGSVEDALDPLDDPAAAGTASASEAPGDEQESTGKAALQHDDSQTSDESIVR
jgi:FtsZ-interacting cell division protein ZipA